jgi:hypothetical protein
MIEAFDWPLVVGIPVPNLFTPPAPLVVKYNCPLKICTTRTLRAVVGICVAEFNNTTPVGVAELALVPPP